MAEFHFPRFKLNLHPDQTWTLTNNETEICFSSFLPRVEIKINGQNRTVSFSPEESSVSEKQGINSLSASPMDIVEVASQVNGIALSVEYGFPSNLPLMLIRLRLTNHNRSEVSCGKITLADSASLPPVQFQSNDPDYACFVNGWQSWSFSGTYSAGERQKIPGLNFIQQPLWHDVATPIPGKRGEFTSDLFTVLIERTRQKGLLAGFLSQDQQFGHAEINLRGNPEMKLIASGDDVRILSDESLTTDWAAFQVVDFIDPDPLRSYIEASAIENKVVIKSDIPIGWCSWYQFYTRITPKNLLSNINIIQNLKSDVPMELIQIDDGFEKTVGDWLECKKAFPDGLEPITAKIRAGGFTPGLWLAPFIVHPGSELYKKHPEMLLRNYRGKPVNSGWNWNAFTTSLDMTHPAAQEYIHKVIDTAVNSWGFPYLKLDFLYAATIPGKHHDPSLTRAQVYDKAMRLIREAAGKDVYILGCGAPIGGMIGHVEAMRIGGDVASDWKPKYHGIELLFPDEPNVPAVGKALQNTITRAWFHNRWWMNDPDCLLLRSTTHLTEEEVRTQASLTAMTGGLVLLSDDLTQIPSKRMKLLQEIIPVIGKTPQILDWHENLTPARLRVDLDGPCGNWHLISFTNWADHSDQPQVDLEDYHLAGNEHWLVSSFRDKKVYEVLDGKLEIGELPPHATWVAAVRKMEAGKAFYAGSSLHISQGMEVQSWNDDGQEITLKFHLPRRADGEVTLWLTGDNLKIHKASGSTVPFTREGLLARFSLQFDQNEEIKIKYS